MANGETYAFMGRAAVLLHPVTFLVIHQWFKHPQEKKVPPSGQIPKNNEDIIKR
jgi:hypothetical protein